MGEWHESTRLESVADMLSGGTPRKSNRNYWKGPIPWLTPKDMGQWGGITHATVSPDAIGNGTRLAPEKAIFIAVRGMSLHNEIRVIRSTEALTFNQDIKAIVAKEGIDPQYLYYVLLSKKPELLDSVEAAGHGTGRLPTDRLKALAVPRFGADAEGSLAELFGALDDKIDLNRRMNETLEEMARAIFKDWFVDFGPTRAKAARCGHATDPKYDREPYLAPELWDLFPDALDDEGKPEGWRTSEIGKEVEVTGGATPSTKETSFWSGGVYHWATPKDLSKLTSPVLLSTDRKITDAGVKKIGSGLLPVGTVLLSSRAPIGYLVISEVPTAVNQGFIAMVCEKRLPNVFVLFWCHENLDYIKGISGGTTFAEISKKAFRPIPVIVPSEPILLAYESLVRPLYERIVANVRESSSLAKTRDLLLPKLMSGEIRVREGGKEAPVSNVVPFNRNLFGEQTLLPDEETERDAVIVAAIVRGFGINGEQVVGNVRYQKGVYFVRRRLEASVQDYQKQAAGPYSPELQYDGGYALACERKFIRRATRGVHEGNVPASRISEIGALIEKYDLREAVEWVIEHFREKDRDTLGVLATVDYIVRDKKRKGLPVHAGDVRKALASDPEWKHKVSRSEFSIGKIRLAIADLDRWFGEVG